MITETRELKIRFFILFISFSFATITLFGNYYLSSDKPVNLTGNPILDQYYLNRFDQWNYNFYDCYNSKLENFIIQFGYGIFFLMFISICSIFDNENREQNINTKTSNIVSILRKFRKKEK
ncbi:MAG: hypothetical protein MUO82_10740 [Candidatus Thermoplasmatota archaeon]|nr:hypothetical protein [Candidatus Thermoplasmatota archaeon]